MDVTQICPVILSLAQVQRPTAAAVAAAAEMIGVPYTISALDGAGHVVLAIRMDAAATALV